MEKESVDDITDEFSTYIAKYIDVIRNAFNIEEEHYIDYGSFFVHTISRYTQEYIIRPSKYLSPYIKSNLNEFNNNLKIIFNHEINNAFLLDLSTKFSENSIKIRVFFQVKKY